MIAHDTNEVELQGEALTEILWRGRQWAVTKHGIEALDGTYPIAADRLEEDLAEWSWIRQLCEKTWVDRADFITAFLVAIVLHGRAPDFDPAVILKHAAKAEEIANRPPRTSLGKPGEKFFETP